MTDPTLEFLESFNDPSKWASVKTGVPIFVPHETVERGEKIVVDKDRLERIAARIKGLEAKRGVVLRITEGHPKRTIGPDGLPQMAPQGEQPDILGYARVEGVGTFGPEQTPAILATTYILPGKLEKAKRYPYRSADFYEHLDLITGVALLETDPRLPMGMVAYGEDGSGCTYYAMENKDMAADPTQKPDAKGPSDEDMAKWTACQTAAYPHLDKMHTAYAATIGPENANPLATPTKTETPKPETPLDPEKAKQMQANQLPTEYAAQLAQRDATIAQAQATIKQQGEALAVMQRDLRLTTYTAELAPLATQYGFDVAKQLPKVQDLPREAFETFKADLIDLLSNAQAKTADPTFYQARIPVDDSTAAAVDRKKEEWHAKAEAHMRRHPGKSWDQALAETPA